MLAAEVSLRQVQHESELLMGRDDCGNRRVTKVKGKHAIFAMEIRHIQPNEFGPAEPEPIEQAQGGSVTDTRRIGISLAAFEPMPSSASFNACPCGGNCPRTGCDVGRRGILVMGYQ